MHPPLSGRWSFRQNIRQRRSLVRRFRPSHVVGPYVCNAGELPLPALLRMAVHGRSLTALTQIGQAQSEAACIPALGHCSRRLAARFFDSEL